jgi:hypothetical protein
MFLPISFVWGWVFHLVWLWTVHGADWVSLLVAAGVSCVVALVRPVIEAAIWKALGTYVGKGARVARALLGHDAASLSKEPAMGVLVTLVGWFIVQLAVMASDAVVTKVILLSVAVVVLVLSLLLPLVGVGGGGGPGECEGAKSHEGFDLTVPLPYDRGKLKFHLDI